MPIHNVIQHNILGNLPLTSKAQVLIQSIQAGQQMVTVSHWKRLSGRQIRQVDATHRGRQRGVPKKKRPEESESELPKDNRLDVIA